MERRDLLNAGVAAATTALGLAAIAAQAQNNSSSDPPLLSKADPSLYKIKPLVNPINEELIKKRVTLEEETIKKSLNYDPLILDDDQLIKLRDYLFAEIDKLNFDISDNSVQVSADKLLTLSKLESQVIPDSKQVESYMKSFLPNQVERLLDQAADLLDRGIRDRTEWDDKAIKCYYLLLELREFRALDEVLVKEVKQGLYDVDWREHLASKEVENKNFEKLSEIFAELDAIQKTRFDNNSIAEQQKYVELLNRASYYWSGEDPEKKDHIRHTPYDNWKETVHETVVNNALKINGYNLSVQQALNENQLKRLENEKDISNIRKSYLIARETWENQNKIFKKERTNVARITSLYKAASTIAPDGILNYIKRMQPLKTRFAEDFTQAYARMKTAGVGLAAIYGYTDPLPLPKQSNIQLFDDCLVWNRKAINHFIRFSQNEINATIPLSLRDLYTSKDEFIRDYDSGEWSFELDKEFFKDKFHVRLKAVSLSLACLGKEYQELGLDGSFKAKIHLPQSGEYVHTDGKSRFLDQKGEYPKISFVEMGRVGTRGFTREPEVISGGIYNWSPIGKWKVKLDFLYRPFVYERKPNGNVRIIKLKYNETTVINGEDNVDVRLNNLKEYDDIVGYYKSGKAALKKHPKFIGRDFLDIQIDLHVTYKTSY